MAFDANSRISTQDKRGSGAPIGYDNQVTPKSGSPIHNFPQIDCCKDDSSTRPLCLAAKGTLEAYRSIRSLPGVGDTLDSATCGAWSYVDLFLNIIRYKRAELKDSFNLKNNLPTYTGHQVESPKIPPLQSVLLQLNSVINSRCRDLEANKIKMKKKHGC